MERLAPFITIHGIDGTGKTSAVKDVVKELQQRDHPAAIFEKIGMGQQVTVNNAHPHPGIAKKQRQTIQLAAWAEPDITVVKDRWLVDVLADAACRSEDLPIACYNVVRPNLSILLTCAEDERQHRIAERGNPTPEDLIPNLPGHRAFQFEAFLQANLPYLAEQTYTLDTTNVSRPEVVALLTDRIIGL